MTKKLAMVFGAVFILVGILGFIPNPIVGAGAIFATDLMHNIVHLLLGIVLIAGASKGAMTLKIVAAVYALVAILGFFMGEGKLLGLVEINTADNWLHLVLALVLFGASMVPDSQSQPPVMPM